MGKKRDLKRANNVVHYSSQVWEEPELGLGARLLWAVSGSSRDAADTCAGSTQVQTPLNPPPTP